MQVPFASKMIKDVTAEVLRLVLDTIEGAKQLVFGTDNGIAFMKISEAPPLEVTGGENTITFTGDTNG